MFATLFEPAIILFVDEIFNLMRTVILPSKLPPHNAKPLAAKPGDQHCTGSVFTVPRRIPAQLETRVTLSQTQFSSIHRGKKTDSESRGV